MFLVYTLLHSGMTPLFTDLPATVQFQENVAVGTYVFTVSVKDWDSTYEWPGTGDTIEYEIQSNAALFAIDSNGEMV